jgi:hypothetical protein
MSTPAEDSFPLVGMDAVAFAVGNAKQTAHYHSTAFGMRRVAYHGQETCSLDEAAYVRESGGARFVFRGPVRAGISLGKRVAAYGDGVIDLALQVSSAEDAYCYAVAHAARRLEAPHIIEDERGKVVVAAIAEQAGRERDALGVVAGAGRDDAAGPFGVGQPGDPDVGAAHLERSGPLQVLAFQVDRPGDRLRQDARMQHRGFRDHVAEQLARRYHILGPHRARSHGHGIEVCHASAGPGPGV